MHGSINGVSAITILSNLEPFFPGLVAVCFRNHPGTGRHSPEFKPFPIIVRVNLNLVLQEFQRMNRPRHDTPPLPSHETLWFIAAPPVLLPGIHASDVSVKSRSERSPWFSLHSIIIKLSLPKYRFYIWVVPGSSRGVNLLNASVQ